MPTLQVPYQCLQRSDNILIAAAGSRIDLFSLEDGSLLSTWKCPPLQGSQHGTPAVREATPTPKVVPHRSDSSCVDVTVDRSSPPAKKRKLSNSRIDEPTSNSCQEKKKKQPRSDAVASGLDAPAVILLAVTKAANHVIAVTGQDKCIRVFENVIEGGVHRLKQISARIMPKRPCALVITEDDSTIISADKFGDVYSLPLIPTNPSQTPLSAAQTPKPILAKPFVPAANEFTIHSQRNRKALENQKRQSNRSSGKLEPTFEHNLLLGHVSLLTDVALATFEGRKYIITADRDEHIRVSRSMPQAHIIEGFCLGHTDFITRLCVPENQPHLLVSGGGDDEFFLWDWRNGQIVSKGDLKKHFEPVRQEMDVEMARRYERRSASERERKCWEAEAEVPRGEDHEMGREEEKSGEKAEEFKDKEERFVTGSSKPAVSGICYTTQPVGGGFQDLLIITCEGIPALFTFKLTAQDELEYIQTVRLLGNVLAVLTDIPNNGKKTTNRIIVSVDTAHYPGSTWELNNKTEDLINPLQTFQFQNGRLMEEPELVMALNEDEATGTGEVANADVCGQLSDLLYNIENLRKRDGEGQEE